MTGDATPPEALERARRLFWGGEVRTAGEEFDRALERWPSDPGLLAGRSAVRVSLKQDREAREDAERAIALDPSCAAAYRALASLLEKESIEKAIAAATRALELEPGNIDMLYRRSLWRGTAGDVQGSFEDMRAAIAAPITAPPGYFMRALAKLSLQDSAGSMKDLHTAIESGFRHPIVYWTRAEARSRLRDRKGAIEDYGRYIEAYPDQPEGYVERGRERACEGDARAAIADYDQALRLAPGLISARFYRAQAKAGLDPGSAREGYEAVCGLEATDAEGLYFRGLAKEMAGREKDAEADFRRALELAPPNHPRRPELEQKGGAPERAKPSELFRLAPVTTAIMVANLAVWLIQGDWFKNPDGASLLARGALERTHVWKGEYWRLFTAMFLHIGPIHLIWNIYGGFSLCGQVERALGPVRFALAYVLTGLTASATSLFGHHAIAAGASGALFGMYGVWFYAIYHQVGGWSLFFSQPGIRPTLWNIGVWFALGMTILPMDNYAHFGGLAAGWGLGWLLYSTPTRSPAGRITAWVAVLVLMGIYLAASCFPWYSGWEGLTW